MFNFPFLSPPPTTYVLCARMCVCYGFSACICPFCFFDLARPRSRFSFTQPHTPTHMRAVCGNNFSIIVEFLLIFFFCCFSFFSPLIFCGVCGCLPRQRLECNLCSLAKCWSFAAAFSAASSNCASLLASRISFYAHPHLLPLVICVIYAYRNKQTRPSQAKPSV